MLNLTTESDFTRNLRRQRSSCFLNCPYSSIISNVVWNVKYYFKILLHPGQVISPSFKRIGSIHSSQTPKDL